MEKIVFTCKTITPLVMNGAYGNNDPELRPPGIKASMRFWWRALHGHLNFDQLREQEAAIFGSTSGRSKLLIRIVDNLEKYVNVPLLEHRTGNNEREIRRNQTWSDAIKQNESFTIRLDCEASQITMIENLFIIACTLGGWGKRSRRGFGAVAINAINGTAYSAPANLADLFACIHNVVPSKYTNTGIQIESTTINQTSRDDYPKLWKIEIGNTQAKLIDIGIATHQTKFNDDTSINKIDYGRSLGDGRTRFASPVYISLLENGLPIISTLKKQWKRDNAGTWINEVDYSLQNKLKNRIL